MTRTSNGERGAVSIIVIALLVTFVGLAAFAADIGLGYAEKRQQSIAADASSLASARAVNDALPPGTACNEGTLEATTSVQSSASTINSANDLDGRSALSQPVDVNCSPAGVTGVEVTVRNSEPVPTTFLNSQLIGVGTLEPPGAAASLVFVPTQGVISGLRPIAACAPRLTNAISAGNEPFLVEINKTSGVCDTSGTGNWGYVNFDDQGQFGTSDDPNCSGDGANAVCQGEWIRNGYQGEFNFPIPYTVSGTGLAGNTGQVKATNSDLAALAGQEILLPVATEIAVGTGQNARLDITGVMAAYVCAVQNPPGKGAGVHVDPKNDPRCQAYPLPTSPGANLLPTTPVAEQGVFTTRWLTMDTKEALLWVVPSQYLTSGGPLSPGGGCVIGDPTCDFGVRAAQLWK